MEQKRNYQREMEQILESLGGGTAPCGAQSAANESHKCGEPAPNTSAAELRGESSPRTSAPGLCDARAPETSAPHKPTLLLHACCGPCSSYCLETLVPYFDITIYYYNPNISPQQEYARRLSELEKFLTRFPDAVSGGVKLVEATYDPEDFFTATNVRNEPELAAEPERGERCRRCYELRMGKAYEYACANGFDWFTTTLSISPHKDAEKINTIGFALEAGARGIDAKNAVTLEAKAQEAGARESSTREIGAHGAAQPQVTASMQKSQPRKKITRFLPSDFKKKNGFLRSTQITEEYGMWRQDYCGCIYSARQQA